MSYKTKLQTNNDNLEGNNIDLQSILNTINNLPAAGSGTEDLDAEITEQEGLIEQIEAALVGKAAGGGAEIDTCTLKYGTRPFYTSLLIRATTINENVVEYSSSNTQLSNVICGSLAMIENTGSFGSLTSYTITIDDVVYSDVYVLSEGYSEDGILTSGDQECLFFKVPNKKDATIVINIT